MSKKIIPIVLLLIFYLFICNKIYFEFTPQKTSTKISNILVEKDTLPVAFQETTHSLKYTPQEETSIGKLEISKISLSQKLYPINDKLNNIEKNVTILENSEDPSIEKSIIFLAAHSGTGPLAYFNNLDKLQINDTITLTYKNITYTYQINNIWEIKKQGFISVNKENTNQLVLTTCSPTNKDNQLIISSILLKKEP